MPAAGQYGAGGREDNAGFDTSQPFVMPGLVPGIHDWANGTAKIVDGRVKPGHVEVEN